jgi:hypothetical protein
VAVSEQELKLGQDVTEQRWRISVLVLDLFEAASGIVGGVGLAAGFVGIPVRVLDGTPFADFTVPALLLGIVVGGSALVAAVITALGIKGLDAMASAYAGCITVGWLTVEIAMIGLGSWAQVFWMLIGLAMIGLSALLWRAEWRVARLARGRLPI